MNADRAKKLKRVMETDNKKKFKEMFDFKDGKGMAWIELNLWCEEKGGERNMYYEPKATTRCGENDCKGEFFEKLQKRMPEKVQSRGEKDKLVFK